jgi:hypothetical protein
MWTPICDAPEIDSIILCMDLAQRFADPPWLRSSRYCLRAEALRGASARDTRGVGTAGRDLLASDAVAGTAAVNLYWLPLGAGGHFVRLNGRIYEALAARMERHPACDLYHSALHVEVAEGTFVIEQAPVHDWSGKQRGVVAEGAVGSRWAGRFRIFRYEVRLWRDGHIPDVAEAADSPRRLSNDEDRARRVLELIAQSRLRCGVAMSWDGRDVELHSVIAWLIARSGIDTASVRPPDGGRGARLACRTRRRAQAGRGGGPDRPRRRNPGSAGHLIRFRLGQSTPRRPRCVWATG